MSIYILTREPKNRRDAASSVLRKEEQSPLILQYALILTAHQCLLPRIHTMSSGPLVHWDPSHPFLWSNFLVSQLPVCICALSSASSVAELHKVHVKPFFHLAEVHLMRSGIEFQLRMVKVRMVPGKLQEHCDTFLFPIFWSSFTFPCIFYVGKRKAWVKFLSLSFMISTWTKMSSFLLWFTKYTTQITGSADLGIIK